MSERDLFYAGREATKKSIAVIENNCKIYERSLSMRNGLAHKAEESHLRVAKSKLRDIEKASGIKK